MSAKTGANVREMIKDGVRLHWRRVRSARSHTRLPRTCTYTTHTHCAVSSKHTGTPFSYAHFHAHSLIHSHTHIGRRLHTHTPTRAHRTLSLRSTQQEQAQASSIPQKSASGLAGLLPWNWKKGKAPPRPCVIWRTHAYAHTHTQAHEHAQTRTRKRTDTHKHAHTHTHAQSSH